MDDSNRVYRFSSAPLINTDAPDQNATINLSSVSSMSSFNKIFATTSFGGSRVIVLTGPGGCLLLQVNNKTSQIQGSLELTVESGLLYGIDNVQFVRTSNVESLNTGKILIGTIVSVVAEHHKYHCFSDNT